MNINLSETQKQIVQHNEGALLVVAGPGSGKTSVLTERIRRLLVESQGHFRILALTFTNKAANEMKERLAEFPNITQRAFIGTLHSFCLEVLANRGKPVGVESIPHILQSNQERKQILLQAVMDYPELKYELTTSGDKRKVLNQWFDNIEKAKKRLKLPEMLSNLMERRVYEAYNEALRASDAVDFDDLLLLTYKLFTERPKIADFYRRQYRYICIDEAQDLNEAQYQVLRALCGTDYKNVMMVGDPKQAIFGWNGADNKYLEIFVRDFQAKKIEMKENFRSSRKIIEIAKALDSKYEVECDLPITGHVELIVGDDEKHEANLVLDYIKNLIDNGHQDIEDDVTWKSCALIGRNRYVLSTVEEELNRRSYPYHKQISPQDESESEILKDFELCLRIIVNPRDLLHLGILANRWGLNEEILTYNNQNNGLNFFNLIAASISDEHQKAVLKSLEALGVVENKFNFSKALDSLDDFANTLSSPEERALVMQDTQVWRKHWDIFLRSQSTLNQSLTSFLSHIALGTTQQANQEGIALLTVHSAKGLEFDVVIIMGMTEGTFPDYRAKDTVQEEEKHNIFVAVTRSKRILGFSHPKSKIMPWGEKRPQQPSSYLKTLKLV